jgi:hypothetical protein
LRHRIQPARTSATTFGATARPSSRCHDVSRRGKPQPC